MLKGYKRLQEIESDVLIVPVFEDSRAILSSEGLRDYAKQIEPLFKSGEFCGKEGELSLIHIPKSTFKRLLLVGLGNQARYQGLKPSPTEIAHPFWAQERLRRMGGKAFRFIKEKGFSAIALNAQHFEPIKDATYPPLYYFAEGGLLSVYEFTAFKGDKDKRYEIKGLTIIDESFERYIKLLRAIADSSRLARDLINSPSNHVTPTFLYETANSLANKHLKVRLLSEKELLKEGMNGFLAVAKGSGEPHRFIVLEYKNAKTSPIVIIGKSITFDSGGISIKPSEGMEKMKYDMAGGACVLALMSVLSHLGPNVSVVAMLPATENMPDAKAYKPGDVIKMMNGKTVEIVSTDAEGRMTLADAISYGIKHYNPRAIIDIATLTGACALTFGNEFIGMMGNNLELIGQLTRSGEETYERVWHMPLCEEYCEYIKGEAADLKNSGGRNGAMLTAGYFLSEFVGTTPWVHLDIASTAWIDKDKPYLSKGASASGLRLLMDFLIRYA
jgi:leucyl aminopeptidase